MTDANLRSRAAAHAVAIEMRDVHKWFGRFHVLRGIDLNVSRGERIVVCLLRGGGGRGGGGGDGVGRSGDAAEGGGGGPGVGSA